MNHKRLLSEVSFFEPISRYEWKVSPAISSLVIPVLSQITSSDNEANKN